MPMEKKKIRELQILTAQGPAGLLSRESQYVFNYRTDQQDCEIALTMPLRSASYAANILPGVLRQNLPEGYLKDWIVERFAKTMKMDDMNIMSIAGRKSIGRVYCSDTPNLSRQKGTGERLKSILTWKGTESLFDHLSEQFASQSGISGVQPKILLSAQPDADVIEKVSIKEQEFIIKSSSDDYPSLSENEYHCMSIAAAAGLNPPAFWLSEDKKLFVIERFDVADGQYLGFEDMTALMNRQNDDKYNGAYEQVATAVKSFASPEFRKQSLVDLFSTLALSIVLRNGDAHLKNFGMLYTHPQSQDARLSPIYDIVTTTAYLPQDVLALKLGKTKQWPLRGALLEFGKIHCEIDRPQDIVERIATTASDYRPAEQSAIWQKMKPIIDSGCFEYAGPHIKRPILSKKPT